MNIFELLNDRYHLPHKPKLFEAFSGIGCQLMAFKRLGIEVESVGFSEIDKYAIQSYKAIHGDIKNWGSICDIKGQDLPQIDIFTYSFPCTDLSKAGKQKGLNQTRSGLVYEVLRILQELHQVERLPKVLIMENVVDLIQVKFIREFQAIQLELENLGYTNYTQTLNAKDYGVAQNRDRVFMVSVLGEYYYEFPKPIKLEKRLKDYLESEVDPKYYISDSFYKTMVSNNSGKFNRAERFKQSIHKDVDKAIAFAITTRAGSRPTDNFIEVSVIGNIRNNGSSQSGNVYDKNKLSPTLCASDYKEPPKIIDSSNNKIKIRRLTEKECGRLMGVNDLDIDKICRVVSRSQMYKQFGNGIVVDVFVSILSTMQGE